MQALAPSGPSCSQLLCIFRGAKCAARGGGVQTLLRLEVRAGSEAVHVNPQLTTRFKDLRAVMGSLGVRANILNRNRARGIFHGGSGLTNLEKTREVTYGQPSWSGRSPRMSSPRTLSQPDSPFAAGLVHNGPDAPVQLPPLPREADQREEAQGAGV